MSLSQIPWQILVIIASLIRSLSLSLNKHQSHKASALQVQSIKYLSASLFIGSFWWLTSKSLPANWYIFFIFGLAVGVNVTIYTQAQRISLSQTSLIRPIGQLLGITLAGLILQEWKLFTGDKGILLIFALILMPLFFWLFYEIESHYSKKWIKLAVTFLTILAVFKVITKILLNTTDNAVDLLVFQYLGAFTSTFIGVFIRKHKMYIDKKFTIKGLIQGVLAGFATLLFYTALKKTTVIQTTLLSTPLVVLLATLSGLIGFKEIKNMTRKKWLGTGVAGIIMILVLAANR